MEELNQLFKGFKVLTTPYDKVDSRVITKKNAMTLLNQIGGMETGADADAPGAGADGVKPADADAEPNAADAAAEPGAADAPDGANAAADGAKAADADGANAAAGPTNAEAAEAKAAAAADSDKKGKADPLGFLEKAKLAAAQRAEEDKGTTIPDGKEMMKKVIKVGAIIVYIMLLPLMPWYYIMKNSYAKVSVLYKGVIKPL